MRPLKIGDVNNVIAELSLDRDGLEWLAYRCPHGDGFTEDLFRALAQVDEELEAERNAPGLEIWVSFRA